MTKQFLRDSASRYETESITRAAVQKVRTTFGISWEEQHRALYFHDGWTPRVANGEFGPMSRKNSLRDVHEGCNISHELVRYGFEMGAFVSAQPHGGVAFVWRFGG